MIEEPHPKPWVERMIYDCPLREAWTLMDAYDQWQMENGRRGRPEERPSNPDDRPAVAKVEG
jgi:hypothetical protein